jgi:putative ABC transport system permease protein
MGLFRKLQYLLPGRRAAEEREMRAEFEALQEFADPRDLGNLTLAAENARAVWGWSWLESLAADVRYAVRVLWREPSFAAVAVLSLALGIGANAAIYSLIDRVLWRQLPVADPESLVTTEASYSIAKYQRFRDLSRDVFADAAATSGPVDRDIEGQPGRVEMVTGNYFPLLGVEAATGRLLANEDERAAVLSYRYWQSAFGGAPVIGQTVRITKTPFTIVGVAPREFFGVAIGNAADVWIPMSAQPAVMPGRDWIHDSHSFFADLVARLRPGITRERASAALTPISVQLEMERLPADAPAFVRNRLRSYKLELKPLASGLSSLRNRFSKPLRALFAMVAMGLLLACVNVMSLQFARADERRRELGVRLAIGAGRGRIVRQLLTESAIVALAGAGVGLAICRPAASALAGLISVSGQPVRLDLDIDWHIAGFVLAIATVTAFLCGLAPALRATRLAASGGLHQGGRGTTAAPTRRITARIAATVQLSLSVVLIAGAFLFSFSLYRLTRYDTGVSRERLLVLDVDPSEAGYKAAQTGPLNRRLLDRLRELPGVAAASYSANGIYTGRSAGTSVSSDAVDGPPSPNLSASYDHVGAGYFATLGARLVAGRDFDRHDDKTTEGVTVISREFATHFFPDGHAIGRYVYMGKERQRLRVIGIVDDIRREARRKPERLFYVPDAQTESGVFTTRFVLRTAGPPTQVAGLLRAAVRAENPALRIVSIDTADQLLDRTLDLDRVIAALSFAFGLLAVTLAAVGIYGMLAYDVARRTPEIGIRMALGATRGGVLALVFREVVVVGGAGVAIGLAGALALGRLVEGMVFELKPGDPRVLAAAVFVLTMVAIAAALAPARRAASLDPMRALRAE